MKNKILGMFLVLGMFMVFAAPTHASTLGDAMKQVKDLSNKVSVLQIDISSFILNSLEVQIKELNNNLENIQSKLNDSKLNNIKSGINSSGGGKKTEDNNVAQSNLNSLSSQETVIQTQTTSIFNIGDSHNGGTIAYIDSTQEHGIIASVNNQGTAHFSFLCPGSSGLGSNPPGAGNPLPPLNGGNQSLLNLLTNSGDVPTPPLNGGNPSLLNLLVPISSTNNCTGSPFLVTDLINTYNNTGGSGYSDWYLPSKDELEKLLNNQVILGLSTNTEYWSSTASGEGYWTGSVDSNGNITWQVEPSGWSAVVHLVRSF